MLYGLKRCEDLYVAHVTCLDKSHFFIFHINSTEFNKPLYQILFLPFSITPNRLNIVSNAY